MSAAAWGWALAIVGTLASIAGVVFSSLAWIEAGNAKKAALEAAESVRVRNLAHNFSKWSVDARDVLRAVRDLEFGSAQRAATDLFGELSRNRGWQKTLHREAGVVEEVVRLLNLVNTYLTDKTVFKDKRTGLAEDCQTIYRRLNELAGSLEAQAEKQ